MIDDQDLEGLLVSAGERQRAAAPDAAETQRALAQLDGHVVAGSVERRGDRRRWWPIALIASGAAAAAFAVFAGGNSGTDTIQDVPATAPEVTTPPPNDTAATDSPADPAVPDQPEELDLLDATTDLSFAPPVVREFEGLPLNDVAVSPEADRIAEVRGDEICVLSTAPGAATNSDRCYPAPSGIAQGSITWSPDGRTLVFHHDVYRFGHEPDLVELDLASGELTVLTDDGVPIDGDDGDTDVAPTFATDGTLYFFRVDTSDGLKAVLHRYDGDGVVTATGPVLDGGPGAAGRRFAGNSIITTWSVIDLAGEVVAVDVDGGPSRSIPTERIRGVAGASRDRALLVAPSVSSGGFDLWVADFTTGSIAPINIPQTDRSSHRIAGGGLSPDGTQVAVIVADQDDPDGHQLLLANITADGSVEPLRVLATGPQFAPNEGEPTIKPAGIGRNGEIVWTDTALIYTLGPTEIVTLPLL